MILRRLFVYKRATWRDPAGYQGEASIQQEETRSMRWKQRPEGSNWGEFGPDDQLGRVNLIGPEQVIRGAKEIQAGISFCLSLPLDYPGGNKLNPRRHPPQLRPTFRDDIPYLNFPLAKVDPAATDVISDDQVLLCLQYSTQWDSLAHVGALFDADGDGRPERVYYNGYRANADIVGPVDYAEDDHFEAHDCGHGHGSHADALGIENFAVKGMQGRGVLVDLADVYGTGYRNVGYEDLMRAMEHTRWKWNAATCSAAHRLCRGGAVDATRARRECAAPQLLRPGWARRPPAQLDHRCRHRRADRG
jgi:hypothetical protein